MKCTIQHCNNIDHAEIALEEGKAARVSAIQIKLRVENPNNLQPDITGTETHHMFQ